MGNRSDHLRALGAGLGSLALAGVALVGVLPGPASAGDGDGPVGVPVEDDNPTCGELGEYEHEFKIDAQPEEGESYDDPDSDLVVTITDVGDGDPMTVSFTTNLPVDAVFVKAGNGGILYTFDPATTAGTGLASPKDSISHVSFCWDDDGTTTTTEHQGTTTTTEHQGTTTTEHHGSTTTTEHDGSTTTTEHDGSTTTTEHDGSTTTTPGEEGSTTTEHGVGGSTPSTQPDGGELPTTGSTTGPLVAAAAGLVACGVALIMVTRRLRQA